MMDKLGGRKFILTIVILILGICLSIFGPKGLEVNVLYLFGMILGVYGTGNIVSKVLYKTSENISIPIETQHVVDNSIERQQDNSLQEFTTDMETIKDNQIQLSQMVAQTNQILEAAMNLGGGKK